MYKEKQFTPAQLLDIYAPQQYYPMQQTPYYRAFLCPDNKEGYVCNYAVLKTMENAEESLAAIEKLYTDHGVLPKVFGRPDGVSLQEAQGFFTAHGYSVAVRNMDIMLLENAPAPDVKIARCSVRPVTLPLPREIRQMETDNSNGLDFGVKMLERELAGGSRCYAAYDENGMAAAMCGVWAYQNAAYITDVYTRPEVRRCGFAAAVVQHAVDEARRLGAAHIHLYASEAVPKRLY